MPAPAEILALVGGFSAGLIEQKEGQEHAVIVAAALMHAAEMILKEVAGSKHAAQQFYLVADRLAAE